MDELINCTICGHKGEICGKINCAYLGCGYTWVCAECFGKVLPVYQKTLYGDLETIKIQLSLEKKRDEDTHQQSQGEA